MAAKSRDTAPIPALEWIAAGLGLLVALFIVGTIGWQAVVGQDDPVPLLTARVMTVTPAVQSHVVTLKVTNASGRTAATVQIEGVLDKGSPAEETSSATIDYVPGHSEAEGALVFSADPRGRPLDLRITGYEHP